MVTRPGPMLALEGVQRKAARSRAAPGVRPRVAQSGKTAHVVTAEYPWLRCRKGTMQAQGPGGPLSFWEMSAKIAPENRSRDHGVTSVARRHESLHGEENKHDPFRLYQAARSRSDVCCLDRARLDRPRAASRAQGPERHQVRDQYAG